MTCEMCGTKTTGHWTYFGDKHALCGDCLEIARKTRYETPTKAIAFGKTLLGLTAQQRAARIAADRKTRA